MANPTYAPKLPIEIGKSGDFEYISDALENIRQNLKMIILTNPGEKILDPAFGLGIRRYLFEPTSGKIQVGVNQLGNRNITLSNYEQEIMNELIKQVNRYNPEIIIEDIRTTIEEKVMFLQIYYNYRGFINDSIGVSINL